MLKLFACIATLCTAVIMVAANTENPLRVTTEVIVQAEGRHHSNLGVVHGVRPCGGPGRFIEWRVTNCSAKTPCVLFAEEEVEAELDFIPSEDIDQLGLKFNIVSKNGHTTTLYERPLEDSAVAGGHLYTSRGSGALTKELQGMTITFQYILYRVANNSPEVCVEADYEIV